MRGQNITFSLFCFFPYHILYQPKTQISPQKPQGMILVEGKYDM